MLVQIHSLKHQKKQQNLSSIVINWHKLHVKDKFQISMNLNSREKIVHLMQLQLLKIVNLFLHKNIQYLVGSNGIQFKIKLHGTQHSDSHSIMLQPIKMLNYWETEIWPYLLEMNTKIQSLHSQPIHIKIYMEMVIQHIGKLYHMKKI